MFAKISCAGLLLLPALAFSGPDAQLPPPPNGFASASASIPKGALTGSITYATRNHGNRPMRVYTPPGYSATRAEKYPVLYLHHGIGGNENAWTSSEGNADRVMDFLYAEGETTPMIVVMPHGKSVSNGGNETFAQFEDILLNDLIPHIERTYNASSDPNMRGIAGLSMGGGQTLNHGFKNFTKFAWIGAFSSAPNTIAAATTIKDPAAVRAAVKFSFISCGTTDGLLNTSVNYHNFLDQNNITPHMYQLEQGQGHTPLVWNRSLYNFAKRIFKSAPTGIRLAAPETGKRPLAFARAGEGASASRVLVSRPGASGGMDLFFIDGRNAPSRAAIPLPSARGGH